MRKVLRINLFMAKAGLRILKQASQDMTPQREDMNN